MLHKTKWMCKFIESNEQGSQESHKVGQELQNMKTFTISFFIFHLQEQTELMEVLNAHLMRVD